MNVSVKLPIMVRVDKVVAIFTRSNVSATSHRKHTDMSHKYANEHVEDDIFKIVLVMSANNESDINTKNLGHELHGKHSNKMVQSSNDDQDWGKCEAK